MYNVRYLLFSPFHIQNIVYFNIVQLLLCSSLICIISYVQCFSIHFCLVRPSFKIINRNTNAWYIRSNIEVFLSLRTLCEKLEELPLLFVVSSHKLFVELLKEEERKMLLEQMRKKSATINLSAKPLPSFYDIPGTPLRHYQQQSQRLTQEKYFFC